RLQTAGAERLAEVDLGGRRVLRAPAERDDQADDRAGDEADEDQPPAQDDRLPEAAELDLLLCVEVSRALTHLGVRAHRAPTLDEAHRHCAANPSSSDTRGCQPRSVRMRVVSACERRWSPGTGGLERTSSRRPATRSSVAIASRIVASTPPPTL